jgi:hypothetical protein
MQQQQQQQPSVRDRYGVYRAPASVVAATTTTTQYNDVQPLPTLVTARQLVHEVSAPSPMSPPSGSSPSASGLPADSGQPVRVEEPQLMFELTQAWLKHPFESGPAKCPVQLPSEVVAFEVFSAFDPPGAPPESLRNWATYKTDLAQPYPRRDNDNSGQVCEDAPEVWALHSGAVTEEDGPLAFADNINGESVVVKPVQKETWYEAYTSDTPHAFYPPFPWPVISTARFFEAQLMFTLNTTHEELASKLAAGNLNIPLPHDSMAAVVRTCTVVPVAIWLVHEAGQLPIDCSVQLVSEALVPGSGAPRRSWLHVSGPNPSLLPNRNALRMGHVVRGGRPLPGQLVTPEIKFWCAHAVTTPEFMRWAATDLDDVLRQLDTPEYQQKSNKAVCYIKGVKVDQVVPLNVPQFLCMSEWIRINAQTALRLKRRDVTKCLIEKSDDDCTFRVDAELIKQMVKEKRAAVNADANIMSVYNRGGVKTSELSHLCLELRPLHADISRINVSASQQFKAMSEAQRDQMGIKQPGQVPVSYHVTLSLRYLAVPG